MSIIVVNALWVHFSGVFISALIFLVAVEILGVLVDVITTICHHFGGGGGRRNATRFLLLYSRRAGGGVRRGLRGRGWVRGEWVSRLGRPAIDDLAFSGEGGKLMHY